MRVAYLISEYPKVSHSFIRREIAELERRGVDVLRIAIRGPTDGSPDPADLLELSRTRYVLGKGLLGPLLRFLQSCVFSPLHMVRTLRAAVRLSRHAERGLLYHLAYLVEASVVAAWMRENHVSHVHAHFGSNPTAVALMAAKLVGGGFSFTAHGTVETDNARGIALSEKIRRAEFVIAVSHYGRAQMLRLVPASEWKKISVVRCGLGVDYIEAKAVPIPKDRGFVAVGRLSEEKGHLVLIEAIARLARAGVSCNVVLAGDGPLRSTIMTRCKEVGVEHLVSITGWVDGETVRRLISASRALVLPSFAEGLPVVVMEAMALGRPVIASGVAGVPELVRHGETGWLVPPGDEESLCLAIRECLDAPVDQLQAMAARGIDAVRRFHDVRIEAGKLEARLRSLG